MDELPATVRTPIARLRNLQFAVLLSLLFLVPISPAGAAGPAVGPDGQDFVFLGDSRPVLIRLHVRVDGKPPQAAWDDFMAYLFNYLDINGDGVLSKEEAARTLSVDLLRGGVGGGIFGGRAGATGPALETLDTDKDGKVTRAELAAYYRKSGFAPFQFQFNAGQVNPAAMGAAFLGGSRPEPSASALSEAIFNRLDTGKDGKLTREKLTAAPAVLLALDEDEDEIITPRELVPSTEPANPLAGLMMLGRPPQDAGAGNKFLVPLAPGGAAPPALVRTMQERYGPKADDVASKKLTRNDLGLDKATFARLDANSDGVLDADELAGFVKREPDLEMVVRLGQKEAAKAALELVTDQGRSPLARISHQIDKQDCSPASK
jgi:Ca2+-binding EF-hand superfamily protein